MEKQTDLYMVHNHYVSKNLNESYVLVVEVDGVYEFPKLANDSTEEPVHDPESDLWAGKKKVVIPGFGTMLFVTEAYVRANTTENLLKVNLNNGTADYSKVGIHLKCIMGNLV